MVHPADKKALAAIQRSQLLEGCPRCGKDTRHAHRVSTASHDMVSLKQCSNCGLVYPNPTDDRAYEKVNGEWRYIGAQEEHQSHQREYAGEDYGEFGGFG